MGILRAEMSWGRKRVLGGRGRRRARFAPRIEGLEGRALLAVLIVTSDADNGMGSLRAAVAEAGNGDIINFDPGLGGHTITLTSGAIDIDKNLTIDGPAPTSSRSRATRRRRSSTFLAIPRSPSPSRA